jgi:3-phenylpropionate/trans-cinnamate dioxygenase ferredoxin reductase subunit
MSAGLVIAGGGLAAQRCCEVLRAAGDGRPVTVLAAEPVRPYDRPPLSKGALAAADVDVAFRPAAWYAEHGVELRLGQAARALDTARRQVVLHSGERVAYDDLLIATGAAARTLPAFARFGNVQTLRTLADADRLRDALSRGGPLVVVGAGLIGLEAAATAVRAGTDVTVIEAAARPRAGVLGPTAATWLTGLHRAAGVRILTGTTVAAAHGGDDVRELMLADGQRLPCAHVLVGIGVRPSTEWLTGSGLGPGAVPVDPEGRTAIPHVYAAGDAACAGGHWEGAARGGAAVAGALLGRAARPAAAASFWSDQHGVRLTCVGDPRESTERLVHGALGSRSFELDHVRDCVLRAVVLVGRPPSALRAARLRLARIPIPERSAA